MERLVRVSSRGVSWSIALLLLTLGGVDAILQGINLFFLSRKRWAVTLIAFLLIGAGYAVSRAGHYGSQLVHIEGVGPQGDFLETRDSHSH